MTTSSDVDDLGERASDARDRLGTLVSELDRRRHLVARARETLTAKPAWTAGAVLALGGLVAGSVLLIARHRRNERRFSARARRFRGALGRMTSHPERMARPAPPTVGKKIMTALVTTVLTTLARQAVSKAMAPRQQPAAPH